MNFQVSIYTEYAYGWDQKPELTLPLIVDIMEESNEDLLGREYKEWVVYVRIQQAIEKQLEEFVSKWTHENPEEDLVISFEREENGRFEEYVSEPIWRNFREEPWKASDAFEEFITTYQQELN